MLKGQTTIGIKVRTLALILVVCSQYLSTVISAYLNSESGYFQPIMIASIILMGIGVILVPEMKINKRAMVTLLFIMTFYVGTKFFVHEKCGMGSMEFTVLLVIPFMAGMQKVDYKRALTYILHLTCISIPVINIIFAKGNHSNIYDAVTMGTSYAILPILVADVMHWFYYRKESKILDKLSYICGIILFLCYVPMSYRGALLSILLAVAYIIWQGITGNTANEKKQISNLRKIVFFVMLCIGVLIIENSAAIILWINDILLNNGISIAFVEKYVYLLENGDVGHGRNDIYITAVKGFFESPLYGHGISTFFYNTGIEFPHNLILQFLYDGGLLLTVPLLTWIIKRLIRTYKNQTRANFDKRIFVIFLFFTCIPRAMVSAETWRIISLWVMLGMISVEKHIFCN